MRDGDFSSDIDALYKLPLGEFVAARNELVKRVKTLDKAAAAGIKALLKPSVSAWAVNQLYWTQPEAFRDLSEAGEAVKGAQSDLVSGSGDAKAVAAATRKKREAQFALVRWAERLLFNAAHAATPATMRRIETTLEVIAGHGLATCDPPPGRLTKDLEAVGFGVFAALAASLPTRPPKPAPPTPAPRRKAPPFLKVTPPVEVPEAVPEEPVEEPHQIEEEKAAKPDPERVRKQERLAELGDLLAVRQLKKDQAQQGRDQLSADLEENNRQLAAAEEKRRLLVAELEGIDEQLANRVTKRESLGRELEAQKADVAELEEQLEEHRAEVARLEAELAEVE